MPLTSFCPNCDAYVSQLFRVCPKCGQWQRTQGEFLPEAGQAFWKTDLKLPLRGTPLRAGARVLFTAGSRSAGGCVAALDCLSGEVAWRVETDTAIEAPALVCGDRLVAATVGAHGKNVQVLCLDVQSGELLWRRGLDAAVRTPLALLEGCQVFLCSEDGLVHGFDLANGDLFNHFPVQVKRGANSLTLNQRQFLIACESGEVVRLNPLQGTPSLVTLGTAPGKISTVPARVENGLLFGLEGGRLARFNLRGNGFEILSEGHKRLNAAPLVENGVAYLGDWNRQLQALELKSKQWLWRKDFEHSVNTTPVLANGLIFVGVNESGFYALDGASGAEVWRYGVGAPPAGGRSAVLCHPLFDAGRLYVGAEDGLAQALPWHLGALDEAAQRAERLGRVDEAASFYAAAADHERADLERQDHYSAQAMRCWKKTGKPQRRVYYHAAQLGAEPRQLAQEARDAARLLAALDPAAAARLLQMALEIYEDQEDHELLRITQEMAAKIANAPLITLHFKNPPASWESRVAQTVVVELKNRGNTPASELTVRLAGSFERCAWVKSPQLLPGGWIEIESPLTPSAPGRGSFWLEARCRGPHGVEFSASRQYEMDIQLPPPSITIDGSLGVGALPANLAQNIHVRGDVGVLVEKGYEARRPENLCPHCHEPTPLDGERCINCGKALKG